MPLQRPPLRLVALGKIRRQRRDRGSRLVRMKPDRPFVLRSVLPAAKIRDPLTKVGGDRPYGRHFCCSCRLTSSALPGPSNAVSTGQRAQRERMGTIFA